MNRVCFKKLLSRTQPEFSTIKKTENFSQRLGNPPNLKTFIKGRGEKCDGVSEK